MKSTNKKTFKEKVSAFFLAIGKAIKNFFTYNPPGRTPRIWELDVLRAILLFFITFDHCCAFVFCWNIIPYQTEFGFKLFEFAKTYYFCAFRAAMQPFGLFLLCFLSGVNGNFAKSNFKRILKAWIFCGVFMGGYALLSYLLPEGTLHSYLMFNIICVLTISYTVGWLLDLVKCPNWIRTGIGILLICIGLTYYYKYFVLDKDFYVSNSFLALMVYNYHGVVMSLDNFEPLLPHLGWFLVGGVVGKFAYANKKTFCKQVYPPKYIRPFLLVGKHSLFFYLFGPAIILVILYLTVRFVGIFL